MLTSRARPSCTQSARRDGCQHHLRREETAATRSLASTAGVMAEQPVLLRLKELESMKEIAARIHEVRVVVGADGLKTLLPAGLLNDGRGKHDAK
jgi:hypothetical protein